MVRYPFDVLRAVSEVEPLTMNGNENLCRNRLPFALRYRRTKGDERREAYLYTPYSLVKSTMAFTFSGLASSKNAPLLTMKPPPLPAVSMSFLT